MALPMRFGTSSETLGVLKDSKVLKGSRMGNTEGILATTTLACITTLTSSVLRLLELVVLTKKESHSW